MLNHLKQHFGSRRTGGHGGLDIARHIGPGLLVTVGFIDPGNWASNMAAGSQFGYALLWIVTLSTIMLIVLQHNAAHLGIATGACLAEATTRFLPRIVGRAVLGSAYLATIATAMAEVLGGAIALQMLFGLPVRAGCVIVAAVSMAMLMTSSYKRAERWIIAFVGVVGLSFLAELALVKVDWPQAAASWITPSMPTGSAAIIVSVLGAVVMPHNLFLHSEVIQSMHFEGQGEQVIEERLRYELFDTLFSMGVGWAINSAMVILCARHGRRRPRRRGGHALPHSGPGELDHLCGSAAVRGIIEQRDSGHGGGNHHCGYVRRGIRHPRPTFLGRGGGLFRRSSGGMPGRSKSF